MDRRPVDEGSGASVDIHSTDPWAAVSARLGVLQILPDLGVSGPARAAVDLAASVTAAGGRAVVASAGGPLVGDLLRCGATHITETFSGEGKLGRWANARKLDRIIRRHGISIVHVRVPANAWFYRKAADEAGCWFVATCHGLHETQGPAAAKGGAVLAQAHRVIAVSHTVARHLSAHYPMVGRLSVVPPGIDLQRFDPARVTAERMVDLAQQWRLPDGLPVVLLPGRLSRSRGQKDLIEAMAHPALKSGELHCIMAGEDDGSPGYGIELTRLAERHGQETRLLMANGCRDMPAAYMLADVVVYTRADASGFARVVAEAQAMGRPIVAYDSPLMREQTGEGRMTWLVPPGDRAALAEAVAEALSLSVAERKSLAPEAIAVARRNYNRAASASAMIEILLELLAHAQAA
jgi:glycosyltransferase involved in cell wall biosynthesis